MNQTQISTKQTIFPSAYYVEPRAAIAWLERVFGATLHVVYDAPDGGVAHAQVELAGNLVMLGHNPNRELTLAQSREVNGASPGIYVVLPSAADVDALHMRASAAGAQITRYGDTDYGSHDFAALDCEGRHWTFGTYDPLSADPAH
jgi:uncharacterized glyoxalase superfamily protein PhnB